MPKGSSSIPSSCQSGRAADGQAAGHTLNLKNGGLVVRLLGRLSYEPVWRAMQDFTNTRGDADQDELWFVEHEPVFTLGQAADASHVLDAGDIPVVKVDRGGQVTYHGPGQLVVYVLLNLRRKNIGVRELVTHMESSLVKLLAGYGIDAQASAKAPGVYVNSRKIASLGLRIRKGCSFHGFSLNVCVEKEHFKRINPCGYADLEVVNFVDLSDACDMNILQQEILELWRQAIGYNVVTVIKGMP